MNPAVMVNWLSWLVQRLPPPLLRALDGWSRRVAVRSAARRRRSAAARTAAKPAPPGLR